ncbi:hypothetical protein AMD26_019085 [Deinococcus sp. UR1]|nr:hypothetical protein AMD26_019085 [Deinococcus sp. UR1]
MLDLCFSHDLVGVHDSDITWAVSCWSVCIEISAAKHSGPLIEGHGMVRLREEASARLHGIFGVLLRQFTHEPSAFPAGMYIGG